MAATSIAFFTVVTTLISTAIAVEVHKVGDDEGWTILGNVNYSAWASTKKFHVGDTIVFVYNPQFHNVIEVKKADYRSCNAASPMKTYSSGNDSIRLERKGHYFFICGFPGHCAAGQSVDIRIPKKAATHKAAAPTAPSSISPSPSTSRQSSPSSSSPKAPAPHPSNAKSSLDSGMVGLRLAVLALGVEMLL